MQLARTALIVAVLSSCSATAWAARTDVVRLSNGDYITGEVVRLTRGRLEFKTDDVGTLQIEWDKVTAIAAARQFDVLTSDGSRYFGMLRPGTARFVVVVTSQGDVALPTIEVTNLFPVGAGFLSRLDGSFDAGFNYTRSSGVATATLSTETSYRRPAFLLRLTFAAAVTQTDESNGSDEPASNGSSSDDRAALNLTYVQYRGRRWYLGGGLGFETNESLGIMLRSQVNGELGLRLVNTNRGQFGLGGGLVVNDEKPVDAAERQNLEGLVAMAGSFHTYDRPRTTMDAAVKYYPSLSDWGRQRLQVDSSLRREVWRDFFIAFTIYDSFDSAPPEPDAARNDVGIVLSVGWTY